MTKHNFRFTPQDHERMKEALDNLSDNPTEEEAEAVLQACGTSGKEVVNEFIERLLKENLGLKQELARRAALAGPRGGDLADVIQNYVNEVRKRFVGKRDEMNKRTALAFMDELEQLLIGYQINRHAPAATSSPAPAESETSNFCGKCEHDLRLPRQFNGWCATVVRDAGGSLVYCGCKCVAAPADNDAELKGESDA